MTYNFNQDWRNRRYHQFGSFPSQQFNSMHCPISNFSTETMSDKVEKKSDLNEIFSCDAYINQLNRLPNPLQKNLADTLPKFDSKQALNMSTSYVHERRTDIGGDMIHKDKPPTENNRSEYTTFSGIGSFLSGVFSVITGAMPFHRRAKSPENNMHGEEYSNECYHDASPPLDSWPTAKIQLLNKNCTQSNTGSSNDNINTLCEASEMTEDCKSAAEQCEEKLAKVRLLLANKDAAVSRKPKLKSCLRRPKKVFIQPGSIEQVYEEDFEPDNLVSMGGEPIIQCVTLASNVDESLATALSSKIKLEMGPNAAEIPSSGTSETNIESTEIIKPNLVDENNAQNICEVKTQIIASCEDKVNKLKALLAEKKKKKLSDSPTDSCESPLDIKKHVNHKPIEIKVHNKKHKNRHRLNSKRNKCQILKNIHDDLSFANEIDPDVPSSVENSPRIRHLPSPVSKSPDCYFDEVNGRFCNASTTDSEESYQIVFTDSPQHTVMKNRKLSDCDSEDSFIVFEDSPDSCYTSHDVFGLEEESNESSDYDSDEDSGHPLCRLNNTFSRTVSDLTDDSLYEDNGFLNKKCYVDSEDEVDSAVNVCNEIPSALVDCDSAIIATPALAVKEEKQVKRVRFSDAPPKVRVMRVWAFAARQARAGNWEQYGRDRERFKRKIADVDAAISWVLTPQHRARVKFQRFMPWWHAERRKEAAEKKEREERERREEEERRERWEKMTVEEREEEERQKKEEELRIQLEEKLKQEEWERREYGDPTPEEKAKDTKIDDKKVKPRVKFNPKAPKLKPLGNNIKNIKANFLKTEGKLIDTKPKHVTAKEIKTSLFIPSIKDAVAKAESKLNSAKPKSPTNDKIHCGKINEIVKNNNAPTEIITEVGT